MQLITTMFNFDVVVDPKENTAGFSPQRDRQPDMTSDSFHIDEHAKYVTALWTSSSRATPEKSCLYVIPKQYDPFYGLVYTQHLASGIARESRNIPRTSYVAISFVCSDPSFERPYVISNYFDGDRISPFRI